MMLRGVVLFLALWTSILCAADTELRLYRPFAATDKHPKPHIEQSLMGDCSEQSFLIKREDAWRCIANHTIYDPCFVNTYGTRQIAVCPYSPWFANSIEIKVNGSLDNKSHHALDMSEAYPWAIELADGTKCSAVGQGEAYDGLPIRYRCGENTALIGDLQRCTPTWKILKQEGRNIGISEIKQAWF
ncbi:hypothetical protein [Legionella londiniensis]|uniref:Uncharacterized protein n=1 Tax=Legionella londiniensis TaxID=45068 RepID=A0A0W0VNM2_9GAMM|nr:hypothetical protein [Legionella londiniensis]KTD21651.1 hypothetical protein Llon_0816 [Legionella londiniensis]STX93514.1 Uncharacterised protein [Legionella londiniensis]